VESNIEVQSEVNGDASLTEVNGDASLTEVKQKGVENNIEVQREVNGDESLTEVKQEGVESNVKMKSEGAATLLAVNVIKFAPFLSKVSDFCSAIPIPIPHYFIAQIAYITHTHHTHTYSTIFITSL
jgi:hypothetical protein